MATYPTNEVHHIEGENHNALYMVVGIILALMLAGFVFFYNDNGMSLNSNDAPGTRVENTINTPDVAPAAGTPTTGTSIRADDNGISATPTTTQQ